MPLIGLGQELGDYYKSNSNLKAKGLNFKIKTPLGFEQLEADRPNIVQKWIKDRENTDLMQTFLIGVKYLPLEATKAEWKDFLLNQDGIDFIIDSECDPYKEMGVPIKVISKQFFVVDNCPGLYYETEHTIDMSERLPGIDQKDRYLTTYTITATLMMGEYNCTLSMSTFKKDVLNKKLFLKLTNSLVFIDQWK